MSASLMTVNVYAAQTNPSSKEQWQAVSEFEGILDIPKTMSTYAQSEAHFLGAYGPVLKKMTLKRLRKEEVAVIDLASVNATETEPKRKNVPELQLSETGRTALRRARLEAERRWCDNRTEILTGNACTISDRERIAILLDLHTLNAHGLSEEEFSIRQRSS